MKAETKERLVKKPKPPKEAPEPKKLQLKEPTDFAGLGDVWFDASTNNFWRFAEEAGWIQYTETQFRRYLKYSGYHDSKERTATATVVEKLLVRIQHNRRVDFAGELSGYEVGLQEMCGRRILISRARAAILPRKGEWNTVKAMIAQLLGAQQTRFYAWVKSSFDALAQGFPWRPGQMLAIAGPAGCGKSLLQNFLTEAFGGRSCKPYSYLSGESQFNGPFFGSEHWMIEDDAASTDIRTRRCFGAMLKNVIVNQVQNYRAMYKPSLSVTPYIRLTMSLNDNPESLMVLPPLEDDIVDKVILLKAEPIAIPGDGKDPNCRAKFWSKLLKELPCFLFAMDRWNVPEAMRDVRYGVKAWQNPELIRQLDSLAPESSLLEWIDTCGVWSATRSELTGLSHEILAELRKKDNRGELERMLHWPKAFGVYLGRLAKKTKDRVSGKEGKGHQTIWTIKKPKEG